MHEFRQTESRKLTQIVEQHTKKRPTYRLGNTIRQRNPYQVADHPSFSSQTIIYDVRPFSPSPNRIHRILQGAPAGFENTLLRGAWSKDDGGRRAAVGGADRMVCIWEVESGKILYKLPGHKGTVTSVDFHPKEPIILTGSKDATMLLGEIEAGLSI